MIKHYLEVHEYINKHIYRLPVGEYQIITEGFGWGMLAGLGIASIIAIAWKLIDNYMKEHGWGSSGSSSSSKDDDKKKGPFNLNNVKAFLNTEHEYVNELKNLKKYIESEKNGIINESKYTIFYHQIKNFGEFYESVFKMVAYIIAFYKYDNNEAYDLSQIYPQTYNGQSISTLDDIPIKDFDQDKALDEWMNNVFTKLDMKDKISSDWDLSKTNEWNYDKIKSPLETAQAQINKLAQDSNRRDKDILKTYSENINNFSINFIRYTVFLDQLDLAAYPVKNQIDNELGRLIDNCSKSTNEKDYQAEHVKIAIIRAIKRDASGEYVEVIKKRIDEKRKENVLYDNDNKYTDDVSKLIDEINKIIDQKIDEVDISIIKNKITELSNKLIGNFTANGITILAKLIKKYWEKQSMEEGTK